MNDDGEALGPSDIAFTGRQKFVLSIGLGGSDEFRDDFGRDGAQLATLVSGKLKHGGWSLFADVLAYEAAANPDGTDIDSNPVGLVRQGDGYLVADAGGNAIVRASHKSTFTTIAVLPPGSALAPPFLGLPPTQIAADAVPTSVVQGPDGAYYVSQLTGFPFEKGAANIWRVVPGEDPTVYASGLTNLTDLVFAPDGSLYAVEIATDGLADWSDRLTGEGHTRRQRARDRRRWVVRAVRRRTRTGGRRTSRPAPLCRQGEVIRVPLD